MIIPKKTKLIACEAVLNEIIEEVPADFEVVGVDVALHVRPESLRCYLQERIDETTAQIDTILLGYGLCARSVEGLSSSKSKIIIPRVHDCIGLLLEKNSQSENMENSNPGTYYLSKGWIESGDHLLGEYNRMCERFGKDKAKKLMDMMLNHYTRVAFIQTGVDPKLEEYKTVSRHFAEKFNLKYEKINGSVRLIRQLITGPWNEDFIILPPGQTLDMTAFLNMETA